MLKKILLSLLLAQFALSTTYGLNTNLLKQKVLNKHLPSKNQVKIADEDNPSNDDFLGIKFFGKWVGSCDSGNSRSVEVGVGTWSDSTDVDHRIYLDNQEHSLNYTTTKVHAFAYGQEVTNSVLRLVGDNRLVLTETTTHNYKKNTDEEGNLLEDLYNTHTKVTMDVDGNKLASVTETSYGDDVVVERCNYTKE